ncbi:MAG TPA: hypothetical protein VGK67_03570 [Myxococcales bacterium]|jgi:C4-dicarboxylate-specific signal transduction histidine kinase
MTSETEQLELEILGRLAPGIAHDFNNLLAAICADADMARRVVGPGHPAQEHLEAILTTVAQGMGLTAHVLVNARPRPVQLREVQLVREVEAVAGLVRRVAGEKLPVQLELSEQAPAVFADPAQLCLALFRLAGTARRALASGGQMRVEVRPEDGETLFAATVTGEGLRPGLFEAGGLRRELLERLAADHGARLTLSEEPGRASLKLALPKPG